MINDKIIIKLDAIAAFLISKHIHRGENDIVLREDDIKVLDN